MLCIAMTLKIFSVTTSLVFDIRKSWLDVNGKKVTERQNCCRELGEPWNSSGKAFLSKSRVLQLN